MIIFCFFLVLSALLNTRLGRLSSGDVGGGLVGEAKAASGTVVGERADCCDRVDKRKVAACTEKI